MKKKLIVAVAAVLVLANGASVAFADSGSNSESNKKNSEEKKNEGKKNANVKKNADEKKNANSTDADSTDADSNDADSNDADSTNANSNDAQEDAFDAERDAYRAQLEAIHITFRTSLIAAENALRTAQASATTDEARALAEVAFRNSGTAALQIYHDSIIALGLKPVKPDLGDEQKDVRKADAAALKAKRVTILETFRAAMESAKDTFKTAKRSATTDLAKKAAGSAFKTAVRTATQIKTDALKALGDNSSHSGGSEGDK